MKITAFKNREVLILALALGLIFYGYNGAEQHFTSYYQTLNIKNLAFNSLAILYGSIVIGNLVGPGFIYKLGVKTGLIFGFATYVALVFGMVTKLPFLIYLLSFCLGVGAGVSGIARIEFLYLIAPIKNRGEYAGIMESVRTFGGFLGIISVSILLTFLKLDQIFIFLAILMLLGLILLFKLKDIKTDVLDLESKNFSLMGKLLFSPKILLLLPYGIAGGLLWGLVLGAVPVYIENHFGIIWVGVITSLFHLTLALVLPVAGYLSDIKGRFILIYLAIAAEILGSLLFLGASSLVLFALIMILLGLGGSLAQGAFSALMIDTFEKEVKEATAVLGILGIILGIIPAFLLPQFLSQNQLFGLAIIISILSAFCIFVFSLKFKRKNLQLIS